MSTWCLWQTGGDRDHVEDRLAAAENHALVAEFGEDSFVAEDQVSGVIGEADHSFLDQGVDLFEDL